MTFVFFPRGELSLHSSLITLLSLVTCHTPHTHTCGPPALAEVLAWLLQLSSLVTGDKTAPTEARKSILILFEVHTFELDLV